MTLDPAALLAGPRGRRLCLELAQLVADEAPNDASTRLRSAIFGAAYEFDPGKGTSRVRLTVAARPGPAVEPTRSTIHDVAHALDEVPLVSPRRETVLRALAGAVDNARYWQEPDGEDVVAATPQVQAALARVAALAAASEHVAWWTTAAIADDQYMVVFTGRSAARPFSADAPRSASTLLETWRAATVADEERARRESPRDPRAGWSGEWWSAPPHDLVRTTRSLGNLGPAGLWLVEDSFGPDEAMTSAVSFSSGARVLELDGPDAWVDLCRRHPLEVTASRRHDWYRTTGTDSRWVLPDWAALALEADAVHLTVAGYLTTAGRALDVADGVATVLAGWDPDATVWLNDTAIERTQWARWALDADDMWGRLA